MIQKGQVIPLDLGPRIAFQYRGLKKVAVEVTTPNQKFALCLWLEYLDKLSRDVNLFV